MSSNDEAYWHLLSGLWAQGEPFVLLEHDIEVRAGTVGSFDRCKQPYCLFPYHGIGYGPEGSCRCPETKGGRVELGGCPSLWYGALGCVRFRPAEIPEGADVFNRIPVGSWRGIDARVLTVLRDKGIFPHIHYPPVLHHHVAHGGCVCGKAHPEYPVDREGRFNG